MVQLIALPQPPQDLQAGGAVRLADQHLLETALQGGVLLNGAAEILGGGGADAAQITTGQGRLEDAGRIAARALAIDHGMEFVEEEHNSARSVRLGHLLEHAAQPFFELTAKLGTGDQGPQIEGDQSHSPQGIGHITGHDALGQPFGHSGLADTRLADQDGIVLAPPGEHLDQTANLGVAADHRIQQAGAGGCGEIAAVALQRRGLPLRLRPELGPGLGPGLVQPLQPEALGLGPSRLRGARAGTGGRGGRGGGGGHRSPCLLGLGAPLAQKQIFAETLLGQQTGTQSWVVHQGDQQMGHIQAALSPPGPMAIRRFQQLFKGLTDVEGLVSCGGLVSAKRLQPI